MKKHKLTLAVALLTFKLFSQTLYTGMTDYNNSVSTYASDGLKTNLNSQGFLNASYIPVVTGGNSNIFINKTDVDRVFNSTPSEFQVSYQLTSGGNSCGVGQNQELNCYGISVKETFVPSSGNPVVPANIWYVIAAAYDSGCLFAGLTNIGAISTSNFFTFPSGANSPTKPLITESATNAGQFYVAGSYVLAGITYMYALHLDAAGTIIWTKIYDLGSGSLSRLEPRAMIESPYSAYELAVVGLAANSTSRMEDGFLMLLDYTNTGTVLSFTTYGTGTSATKDYFSSIAIANSTTGGNGFVIGGYTEDAPTLGRAWMLKVDPAGAIIWNYRYKPSAENTAGDIVGVIERYSSTYSAHEYYGVAPSPRGSVVIKIDDFGAPHSVVTNPNNEFYYQFVTTPGAVSYPVAISYEDNGGVNDGIHVYGGNDIASPSRFFLSTACFNGAAGVGGCLSAYYFTYQTMNGSYTFAGPSTIGAPSYNINPGISACVNHVFTSYANTCTDGIVCAGAITLAGTTFGNQSKSSNPNGLKEYDGELSNTIVYPNPVKQTDKIYFKGKDGKPLSLLVWDSFGRCVGNFDSPSSSTEDAYGYELQNLHLSKGLYFVDVKTGKGSSKLKLFVE